MPLLYSTLSKTLPAGVFVETGTYNGDGVRLALRLGFLEIHTVELEEARFPALPEKFNRCPEVSVYQGESGSKLPEMIRNIKSGGGVVFWLDAHPPGNLTLENCPIVDELDAIENAPADLKVRAVMIDDLRLFQPEDIQWMTARLKRIFPKGEIVRLDGIEDGDILAVINQ